MRVRRGIILVLALLAAVAVGAGASPAAAAGVEDGGKGGIPHEYRLKAAFVDRFLNFVEWTGAKTGADSLRIDVAGPSPLADALRAQPPRESGTPLVIVTAGDAETLVRRCHVVFVPATIGGVPRAAHPRWGSLDWTAGDGVLTIGEDEGFTAAGGVIGFYTEDDRLRFAVSTGAAGRAGLQIGSKLLRLAKIVP